MFDDERREGGGLVGGEIVGGGMVATVAHVGHDGPPPWRAIDRALRACARRRAALDADEARWLVEAERLEIHREVGCGSLHEYLERVLGYGPRVGRDRLRVARALAELPAMTDALSTGDLSHSAVRELCRVATPATEGAWIDAARGRCLREIELLVGGRERGDLPDDPDDAAPRPVIIRLEVSPTTMALYREATRRLEDQTGDALTDDQVLDLLCRSALDETATASRSEHPGTDADAIDDPVAPVSQVGELDTPVCGANSAAMMGPDRRDDDQVDNGPRSNRAPYQIAVTVCETCRRGWHDAAGRPFALPASALERAWCDAELLGRVDGDMPARVARTIPPAIRRQVMRRDRGHCIVPGCRAARHLEVHHVIPRARGGTHDPLRLAVLCSRHHDALHQGQLDIAGRFPDFIIGRVGVDAPSRMPHLGHRAPPAPSVTPPANAELPPRVPAVVAEAITALCGLGFSRGEAGRAVREAMAQAGASDAPTPTLDSLLRAALRALRPNR